MTQFRMDEYNCTGQCIHYNDTNICNKGYNIITLTESGTCTNQPKGYSLSYGSCRFDYINSSTTYLLVSDHIFKLSSDCLDKYYFPLTVVSGFNDTLKVEMDGVIQAIVLSSGTDLLPQAVAEDIQFRLRSKSIYTNFFRSKCEFINNRFEISSPTVTGSLTVLSGGSANRSLGFSSISNTQASNVQVINSGTGNIAASSVEQEARITTIGSPHNTSMTILFDNVSSGSLSFDYSPYILSHIAMRAGGESDGYVCHSHNESTSWMDRYFTSTTGFYFEAMVKYVVPSGYTDVLINRPIFDTQFYNTTSSSTYGKYWFERDYYHVPLYNKYIPANGGWNKFSVAYDPYYGYVNYSLNDVFRLSLADLSDVPDSPSYTTTTGVSIDKVRYYTYNDVEGDFYMKYVKLYKFSYDYIVASEDYDSYSVGDIPTGWTVYSGGGPTCVGYTPVVGGKAVLVSGSSSYFKKSFDSCSSVRAGFRIYHLSSGSGTANVVLEGGGVERLRLTFAINRFMYDHPTLGSIDIPSGTDYLYDHWYRVEVVPDCGTGKFNIAIFDDYSNQSSKYQTAYKGKDLSFCNTGSGIDTIKFISSGGDFYIKDVQVEDFDLTHNRIYFEDFNSHPLYNQPSGWDLNIFPNPNGYPNSIIVTTESGGSNRAVRIDSVDTSYRPSSMMKYITPLSRLRVRYDSWSYRSPDVRMSVLYNDKRAVEVFERSYMRVVERSSSRIFECRIIPESGYTYYPTVVSGVWTTRDVIVDCTSSTFSYYFNNELFGRYERFDPYFLSSTNTVNCIKFSGVSWDASRLIYLDNIHINAVGDLIKEDFNNMNIDESPLGWTVGGSALVKWNPAGEIKCLVVSDISTSNYSYVQREFEPNDFIISRFSTAVSGIGFFKIAIGNLTSGTFTSVASIYPYIYGQYGVIYRSEAGGLYMGFTTPNTWEKFACIRQNDFANFEMILCKEDRQSFLGLSISGTSTDQWPSSRVLWRFNLSNTRDINCFQISTNSYGSYYGSLTTSGAHKNIVYLKNLEIFTYKKGDLIFSETFVSGTEGQPPDEWTVNSGAGYIKLETSNKHEDFGFGISMWDDDLFKLTGANYTSIAEGAFNVNNSYNMRINFNCLSGVYNVFKDGVQINSDYDFYMPSNSISYCKIGSPEPDSQNQHTDVGIDNFRVMNYAGNTIASDGFEYDVSDTTPSYWDVVEDGGEIRVWQSSGISRPYIGNVDDFFTVTVVNGSNVLAIDSYEYEGYTYAEKTFGPISDGNLIVDIIVAAEYDEDRCFKIISATNNDMLVFRFNYSTKTIQYYDGSSWNEFFYSVTWNINTWYRINFEFYTTDNNYSKIVINDRHVDTLAHMSSKDSLNKIRFYKPYGYMPDDEQSFCVGYLGVTSSGGSVLIEDFKSYALYEVPSSWTVLGSRVRIQENPYFLNKRSLINYPVEVTGVSIRNYPIIYGDWCGNSEADFYITVDTSNGARPGLPGTCPRISVSGSSGAIQDVIDIVNIDHPYRITNYTSVSGNLYINFPRGFGFIHGSKFKVHCDSNNNLNNLGVGDMHLLCSSDKGQSVSKAIATSSGVYYYQISDKGVYVRLDGGKIYNDGDRFYITAYTAYPVKFDMGNSIYAGAIRIGEDSDIKCIKVSLKEGMLFIEDDIGLNTTSWSLSKVGSTKILFAFTSVWPDRPLVYADFERNYLATPDWTVVTSGTEHLLYRDSMKFIKDNYIFFYLHMDEDQRGAGSLSNKIHYDEGDDV